MAMVSGLDPHKVVEELLSEFSDTWTGKTMSYAAKEWGFRCRVSDWYKNSDLRSKCANGTVFIGTPGTVNPRLGKSTGNSCEVLQKANKVPSNLEAATPNLVENTPEPENHQSNIPRVVNEDLPEILNLEGPNPLVLDTGSGIFDGLSDPDKSPDDAKIVDASDLQQFASALQEAQRRAVEVEREIAKGK
ncbi:hypothetical protein V8E53_002247 [Lactarius tabidus]